MLKTVWLTEKPHTNFSSAMLLGGFDGLHVGHTKLLQRAQESGFPVGVMSIVGGKEKSVFTFEEREEIFKNAGVDFVFELPFAEIKDMSPQSFLRLLQENFQPALFVCGEDFRFGANAQGTPEMLKQQGQVCVEILPLVKMYGEKVSTRTIKTYLAQGDISRVSALLGGNFFLLGEVVSDRKVGRTIGFPTANIRYPIEKFPLKIGVYETRVTVDRNTYKGITNYGTRPTFDNEEVLTETFLDGFDGDLYGRNLKVEFVRFLREIRKFERVEELKAQLQVDIQSVRQGKNYGY